MTANKALSDPVWVAPRGMYRVVGVCPTRAAMPDQFFRHNDYTSFTVAVSVAVSLNELLTEDEDSPIYYVYDDLGLRVG